MASPITWQNVNGPSLADAAAPMKYAQQMFGSAFDGLQKELDKRQLTETQNWDQGVKNNTAAFLNSVNSPENAAVFDAQRAGLKQQLSGFGAQIDQNAARTALDGRLNTLQQRDLTTMDVANKTADNAAAPVIEAYKVASLKGDKVTMAAIEAAHPAMRGMSGAQSFERTVVDANTARTRSAADEAQKVLMRPLAVQEANSKLLTEQAQRGLIGSQSAYYNAKSAAEAAAGTDDEKAKARFANEMKDNRYKDGVYDPAKDAKDTIELIKLAKGTDIDQKHISDVMERLNRIQSEGGMPADPSRPNENKIPLSKGDVKAAISAMSRDWTKPGWLGLVPTVNTGYGQNFEQQLKQAIQTNIDGPVVDGKGTIINPAVNDYRAYQNHNKTGNEQGNLLDVAIAARKKKVTQ